MSLDPRWTVTPAGAQYRASVEGVRDECPDVTDTEAAALLVLGIPSPDARFTLRDLLTVHRAAMGSAGRLPTGDVVRAVTGGGGPAAVYAQHEIGEGEGADGSDTGA